jgi:hypothetical protein
MGTKSGQKRRVFSHFNAPLPQHLALEGGLSRVNKAVDAVEPAQNTGFRPNLVVTERIRRG